jgi:hypothetical protein
MWSKKFMLIALGSHVLTASSLSLDAKSDGMIPGFLRTMTNQLKLIIIIKRLNQGYRQINCSQVDIQLLKRAHEA